MVFNNKLLGDIKVLFILTFFKLTLVKLDIIIKKCNLA